MYLTPYARTVDADLRNGSLGLLITPESHRPNQYDVAEFEYWAADNGCFTLGERFDLGAFLDWLSSFGLEARRRCIFATAPDVVGDWTATLARALPVLAEIRRRGFPAAIVLQDGATPDSVPWDDVDAVFVGGSTEWKLSAAAAELLERAAELGKWRHMGRVNSAKRMTEAAGMGALSVDGTLLVFGPEANRPRLHRAIEAAYHEHGDVGLDPDWNRYAELPELSTCPHCGELEYVEVFEVWGRDFMLETCCEGHHEAILEWLNSDEGDECRAWLRGLLEETGVVAVRQVFATDGGHVRIDHGLELEAVDFRTACAFVDEHHRHHERPRGWRWGHAVYNGPDLVGVAMVGRPVARAYNGRGYVEVNRLCIDPTLPAALTWCAASMLYGAAAREAKRRGFVKVITYTLESEAGTSLRGAGWELEAVTAGGSWNCKSRPREDRGPTCRKHRWARRLAA